MEGEIKEIVNLGVPTKFYTGAKHKCAEVIYKAGLNLYMVGPAGCGKTTYARLLAGPGNFYLVSCSADMVPGHLIGHMELKGDNTFFVYGPLIRSMQEGKVLILDEFDRVSEEVASKCHEVLEAGQILVEQTSEMIYAHPNFRIIATGNSKMQGSIQFNTLSLDLASIDRFEFVEMDYTSAEEAILVDEGLSAEAANALITDANFIRTTNIWSVPLSTRRLKSIAKLWIEGMVYKDALYYGFLSRLSQEEQDEYRRLTTTAQKRSEVWVFRPSTPINVIEQVSTYLTDAEKDLFKSSLSCAVGPKLLIDKEVFAPYIEQVKHSKLSKTTGVKNAI